MRSLLLCMFLVCGVAGAEPRRYEWVQTENVDQWALMDYARPFAQRQVGVYEVSRGEYSPLVNDKWMKPEEPPAGAGLPPGCAQRALPTGVMASKIPSGDHVYHNGKEISKEEALALLAGNKALHSIEGDKIPDDSKKIRVNVIGTVQGCAAPVTAAKKHAEFAVTEYRPEAWMINRQGFYYPADPTIYIQQPDGTVIRRLDGWQGDELFDKVLQEVVGRKIGPNPAYEPAKDEGWFKKNILPVLQGDIPWIPVVVVAGLLGYALWSRRKKVSL